ncbi:beta-lactamase family protein [Duganella sp. FT3S]|uniref:Beta-lactamase family protein n=1 Tax=Rugamonas fusca TaxID=2758568 RepID=A0A7W2I764_9BURK|nr:serine hydrolase domain-containing protein [Rugamonas fusca]MBA5606227.1 beta-lactamase family protein [Rugamonas fusca]
MNERQDQPWITVLLRWALPLGGWCVAQLACAIEAPSPVDRVVQQAAVDFMAAPHAVGLSIGVIEAGKSYRYHFGTVSTAQRRRPDDATLYPIASLTKTFTGALLAQAALDNKLALDDDVRRYLGAGYDNLCYEQQPVRLYHLLNHRSGLPFVLPDKPEAAPGFGHDAVPFPQRIDAIIAGSSRAAFYADLHRVKLSAPPGEHFQYSNAAAQLAGYILERRYGSSFDALLRQQITGPLGMRDTVIVPNPQQQGRLVIGYDDSGTAQPYGPVQSQAAGALKSSLADMLAYARWQLDERDPAVALSHQPTYAHDDYAVGLNWQMLRRGPQRVIWQDGAIPGFASLLVLEPEAGVAIVLLSNELDSGTLGRLRTLANTIASGLHQDALAVP